MVACGSVFCRLKFDNVLSILYFLLFQNLVARFLLLWLYLLSFVWLKAVAGCGNGENDEWRPAEAALFCIRAISNYVSVVEAEVMPQVKFHSNSSILSTLFSSQHLLGIRRLKKREKNIQVFQGGVWIEVLPLGEPNIICPKIIWTGNWMDISLLLIPSFIIQQFFFLLSFN